MTYQAVINCCSYRMDCPEDAELVAETVIRGLLARPRVFRYFGLPYSGRIARLAERKIAELRADPVREPGGQGSHWCAQAVARLRRMPEPQRTAFVQYCVDGDDIEGVAALVGCDETEARAILADALATVESVAHDDPERAP